MDPRADNTDLYAFVSPDEHEHGHDDRELHPARSSGQRAELLQLRRQRPLRDQDRPGRGRQDDIGYQFRFNDADAEREHVPLQHRADHLARRDPSWNRPQTYDVTLVHFNKDGNVEMGGKNKPVVLGSNIPTPPDNIGPRSTPNYDALAAAAVTSLPGGIKVFAGQRDDPFFVDLGSIFDLAGLRPFNPFHLIPLPAAPGVDALTNYNTHSIVMQVPICAARAGSRATTVGIYATREPAEGAILTARRHEGRARARGCRSRASATR